MALGFEQDVHGSGLPPSFMIVAEGAGLISRGDYRLPEDGEGTPKAKIKVSEAVFGQAVVRGRLFQPYRRLEHE
jgi:hypothetical protein